MTLLNQVKAHYNTIEKKYPNGLNNETIEKVVQQIRSNYDNELFMDLLSMVYFRLNMSTRTHEMEILGNIKFRDNEDYFSDYVEVLYKAIYDYDFNFPFITNGGKKSFVGYVSGKIDLNYRDQLRNSYLKQHGSMSDVDRKKRGKRYTISTEAFGDSLGYVDEYPYEDEATKELVHKAVSSLMGDQKSIILLKYFSKKKMTDERIGKVLGLNKNQVAYQRKQAEKTLAYLLKGVYFTQNTSCVEFLNDNPIDNWSDVNMCSSNNWKSHYNYYNCN